MKGLERSQNHRGVQDVLRLEAGEEAEKVLIAQISRKKTEDYFKQFELQSPHLSIPTKLVVAKNIVCRWT